MGLKYLTMVVVLIILLITAIPASAVDIGGAVEIEAFSVFGEEGAGTVLQEKLNLEFFLPENKTTAAKFEVDIITNSSSKDNQSQIKKLYLQKRLPNLDLTLGRQPISWMFGSLINPVDFSLGGETVGQETATQYNDAVELYYPINWGSSMSGVLTAADNGKMKVGLRGRTTVSGYDLTANFVKEQNKLEERVGATVKGDLGAAGVYGAVGYYLEQQEQVFLGGADYSFYHQDLHQVILQGEYIYDKVGMSNYLGGVFSNYSAATKQEIGPHLITAMLSYSLDDFKTVKLTTLLHPKDSSVLVIPEYEAQLLGDLDFNLRCGFLLGSKGEVFGPRNVTTKNNIIEQGNEIKSIMELTVTYPF
ncbi:MAG: hypothetical protein ACQERJ_06095 [Bacillota bacterium]